MVLLEVLEVVNVSRLVVGACRKSHGLEERVISRGESYQ